MCASFDIHNMCRIPCCVKKGKPAIFCVLVLPKEFQSYFTLFSAAFASCVFFQHRTVLQSIPKGFPCCPRRKSHHNQKGRENKSSGRISYLPLCGKGMAGFQATGVVPGPLGRYEGKAGPACLSPFGDKAIAEVGKADIKTVLDALQAPLRTAPCSIHSGGRVVLCKGRPPRRPTAAASGKFINFGPLSALHGPRTRPCCSCRHPQFYPYKRRL